MYHQFKRQNRFTRTHIVIGIGVFFLLSTLVRMIFGVSGKVEYQTYTLPSEITFAGTPVPLDDPKTYERVDTAFQILVHDQRGQITVWLKRLNKYRNIIENILEEEALHKDYLYVSVKESSLRACPQSVASAKGWWQFIPATGERFGLKTDDYIEERCDLFKSTRAAAKYLKILSGENFFLNDPFAAMAAYNFGEGNVGNLLKNQGNNGGTLGYFSSLTNDENARYVPGIIALKVILEDPEAYGFELPDNEDYKPWSLEPHDFALSEDTNIVEIVNATGLDYLDFMMYNPHFRVTYTKENFLPASRIFTVYLPPENKQKLQTFLRGGA